MRILFTTNPQSGHFGPIVPIARAAADAGHDVAIAAAASFAPTIERAGFRAVPAGFDRPGYRNADLFPGFPRARIRGGIYWTYTYMFIRVRATLMVPDLLITCREWRPDVIVRESCEFGGCVAAEVLGIPHASIRTDSVFTSYPMRHLLREPLTDLREINGLPPDPDVRMPFRYLHLAGDPPGFLAPGDEPPPTAHLIRPVIFDRTGAEALPEWVAELPDRPTLYVTLGTVAGNFADATAYFAAFLTALRDEPINLILTVGRGYDPAQLGPQPENVHIEQYVPQSLLLPYCDAVLHHGGSGTTIGVLEHGLPMVVLPLRADQPHNAACCAALGVARTLDPDALTAEAIREAVRAVITDRAYRGNAESVRDAMAALPGPEHAVGLLERLAVEKRPIPTT